MLRRHRFSAGLFTFSLFGLWFAGCGDNGSSADNLDGSQGGSSSGGANGSTGGSDTSNAGAGAGGGGQEPARVPGTENYDCSAPSGTTPNLALLPIGGSFTRPVLVTHPPGDTTHLFVVEQNGKIWIVTKAGSGAAATYTKSAAPFLDVTDTTRSPSDGISGYQ